MKFEKKNITKCIVQHSTKKKCSLLMSAFRKQLPQLASFNLISSPIGPNLRRRKNPHNRIKIQFRRQLPKPPPGVPAPPFDPHLGPRIIIAALNHISRTPLWSLICIATCNLHVQKKTLHSIIGFPWLGLLPKFYLIFLFFGSARFSHP